MADNLQALLDRLAPAVRDAFLAAIYDVRSEAQLAVIVGHIERGDIEAALRALNLDPAFFAPLDDAITAAYLQGGRDAAAGLPAIPSPFPGDAGRIAIRFDGRNPRAEAHLRSQSSRLITEIVEDQREGIGIVLRQAMTAGRNPRSTALDIVGRVDKRTKRREGGLVGLTGDQMQWAENARSELVSGDPGEMGKYLKRQRRDRRFDRTVETAIRDGKPIAAADVRRIVERYNDRLLKYRGDVIGRTEALTAMNAAKHENLKQVVDSGGVRSDQIERIWDATGDGRTRDSHMAMDGQTVGLDEPFRTPEGHLMMYPGDTSLGAPARETIQCRCFTNVRIDFLTGFRVA